MELLVAQEPATLVVELRAFETDTEYDPFVMVEDNVEELTLPPVKDIKLMSNELSKQRRTRRIKTI
jgi:hypothetical protein